MIVINAGSVDQMIVIHNGHVAQMIVIPTGHVAQMIIFLTVTWEQEVALLQIRYPPTYQKWTYSHDKEIVDHESVLNLVDLQPIIYEVNLCGQETSRSTEQEMECLLDALPAKIIVRWRRHSRLFLSKTSISIVLQVFHYHYLNIFHQLQICQFLAIIPSVFIYDTISMTVL